MFFLALKKLVRKYFCKHGWFCKEGQLISMVTHTNYGPLKGLVCQGCGRERDV